MFAYSMYKSNIISSKSINFNLFFPFKYQHRLQHKKYKMPNFSFQRTTETNLIFPTNILQWMFNFLYHFCRIDDSFLKYDLDALSYDYENFPIVSMTQYEMALSS